MSYLPGKQPQSDQARTLRTREDTCSPITQHLSALSLPGAISRVLRLGEEKGGALVERQRETQWAPPPAQLQFQIFATRGLPSSTTTLEEGRRERNNLWRIAWNIRNDPEQRGDLAVICSEAADPSCGCWENIQPPLISLKGLVARRTSSPPLTLTLFSVVISSSMRFLPFPHLCGGNTTPPPIPAPHPRLSES